MTMKHPPLKYEKYSKAEIERITGLSQAEFFDLVRLRPNRGGDAQSEMPFFIPSKWHSRELSRKGLGKGYTAELSFSDLVCLSILKVLKANRQDKSIGRFIWSILGTNTDWWHRFELKEIVVREEFEQVEGAPEFRMEVLYDQTGTVLGRTVMLPSSEKPQLNHSVPTFMASTPEGMRDADAAHGPLGHGQNARTKAALREAQVRHFENQALGKLEINLNRINQRVKYELRSLGR